MDIATTAQNKSFIEKQSMPEQLHISVSDQQGIDQEHSEVKNPANGNSVHIEASSGDRTVESSVASTSAFIEDPKQSIPATSKEALSDVVQQSDEPEKSSQGNLIEKPTEPTEVLTSTFASKETMSNSSQLIEATKAPAMSNPAQPIKESVSNDVHSVEASSEAVVSNPVEPVEASKATGISNLEEPVELSKEARVSNPVVPVESSEVAIPEQNNPFVQQGNPISNPAKPIEISKGNQVPFDGNNETITPGDCLKLKEMEKVSSADDRTEVATILKHDSNPAIENGSLTEKNLTNLTSQNLAVANLEQQTIDQVTTNNEQKSNELLSEQCEIVKSESTTAGLETEHQSSDVKSQDTSSEASGDVQPSKQESVGSSLHQVISKDQLLKIDSTVGSKSSSIVSSFRRAEIDTAAPFESVKAAVSMFGERMDWKSQPQTRQTATSTVDRSVVPEHTAQKLLEEIEYNKAKLSSTQASTSDILRQLENVKEIIYKTSGVSDPAVTSVKDKTKNIEFELVQKEMERVKEELCIVTVSKQAALEGLQGARTNLDMVSKRIDELAEERKALSEAMNDAQNTLGEVEDQVSILKSGGIDSQEVQSSDLVEVKSAEIKLLESKLEETNAAILKLKDEIKETEKGEKVFMTENGVDLQKVKSELEDAKSKEINNVKKIEDVLTEIDDFKAKVEKATQDRVALSSAVLVLKAEIERGRMELDEMHEKEHAACENLAALQDELMQVKDSLTSAKDVEAKAIAAKETLPTEIKQAALEADKAKVEAEQSKEEARKARHEFEEAKAAASTALSRLQAAVKEAEAARACEAMALAELKALSVSENQGQATNENSETATYVNISLEEYSSLKSAADEAEDRSGKRVAEVYAHVEQARASQLSVQSQLDDAIKQSEACRRELEEAQKKAEFAQEAKLTSEAAFRKWRAEHEQLRKPVNVHELQERKINNDQQGIKLVLQEKPIPHERKAPGPDSLSQVLSLRVPRAEVDKGLPPLPEQTKEKEKTKKKPFIKRIASAVVGKKGNGTVFT